jgi:polyhydroxybutyrate depolymerase
MQLLRSSLVCSLAAILAGCGGNPAGTGGAGAAGAAGAGGQGIAGGGSGPDAGAAGAPDAGAADAGATGSPDAGASGSPDAGIGAANVPGRHDHTIVLEGVNREVIVYVPMRAAGATPVPAVFMLHGTSGDGEKFLNISGWREKADAEGFIAVFPSALTYCLKEDENADGDFDDPGERKVTTKWAAGKLGNPAVMPLCTAGEIAALPPMQRALVDHPIKDDVAFARAMLDLLASDYAVDAKRVYASGFSNGANMTARLTVEASDRFAALAGAAGLLGEDPVPGRPLSYVLSVGEVDDRFMPFTGGVPLPLAESLLTQYPLFKARAIIPLLVTLQLADAYTYEERTVAGRRIARFTYAQSLAGARNRLTFAVIEGLGHVYPNGTNHPLVAADVLWEAFRNESLP